MRLFKKYFNIFYLLLAVISVITLASCNDSDIVLWDEIPTTYTANYGTVFKLPEVRVQRNGFYLMAEPIVSDSSNKNVIIYDYQFYVSSKSNYSLYYQYEYNGVVEKSETYTIKVENKGKPIIELPLQTEYIVKIGDTFTVPFEEVKVYMPEESPENETLKYEVFYGEQKVEVTDDSFVVENKGLYNVVFSITTAEGVKEEQSLVVYGDERSRDVIADFEGEYGEMDIQKFGTGKRGSAYTPATLNTDPKFTHDKSSGSLKAVRNNYTVYTTLSFTPEVELKENEPTSITFWMYLDTAATDTYLSYLRLKVSDSSSSANQKIHNIFGVGTLTNMGSQWIPCTFEIDSTHKFPLSIELFSAGDNDTNRFSIDVYFDDFAVTQVGENIPGSYRLSLEDNETEKVFDTTFIKEDLVTVAGAKDYTIKAISALDSSEIKIDNGKIIVKENEPVILKYFNNDVQVVNTTYIYAEKENPNSITTYKWDGANMTSVGNNSRIHADDLDIILPNGIESVYKISKNGTSAKPSITFGDIDLDIKNNSRLSFKIYIPESMWIPNLGTTAKPDLQSCPFGFTGMSFEYGNNKPVVQAFNGNLQVLITYQSGIPYIPMKGLKGKWIDVIIDFSATDNLDLSGLGIWFNNFHDPARGAENDPQGFDSYVLLTDMVLSETNSPIINDFNISELKVGDSYNLNSITISDESSFTVYKYIECNGKIINLNGKSKITFDESGVMKLKVIVSDKYGNYSFVEKEFRVAPR